MGKPSTPRAAVCAAVLCAQLALAQPVLAQPPALAAQWRCGAQRVTTAFTGEAMALTVGRTSFSMRQAVSGSGARYEAIGDSTTSAWTKGNTMMLTVRGRAYPQCLRDGAAPETFRAIGQEPGWRLDIAGGAMRLVSSYGQSSIEVPAPTPEFSGSTLRYVVSTPHALTATVFDRHCSDSMSGMPFPKTVTVVVDGNELQGCGGDPLSLLQGVDWRVQSIGGVALVKGSKATLFFGVDGKVGGNASCNHFTAGYTLTGESLTVERPASTMKACAPKLMKQEGALLKLLAELQRFEVGTDNLTLIAADGRRLVTRR